MYYILILKNKLYMDLYIKRVLSPNILKLTLLLLGGPPHYQCITFQISPCVRCPSRKKSNSPYWVSSVWFETAGLGGRTFEIEYDSNPNHHSSGKKNLGKKKHCWEKGHVLILIQCFRATGENIKTLCKALHFMLEISSLFNKKEHFQRSPKS